MLRVHKLLHDAPDLMNGLWEFLGEDPVPIEQMEALSEPKGSKLKQEPQPIPQKRKRREKEREKDGSGKGISGKVCHLVQKRRAWLTPMLAAQRQT